VPKAAGAANSGDTLADLGLHVDGTQHIETPCVLMFHYVSAAKLGATSVFVDTAKVLLDIKADRRQQILVNLARSDAATFSKKKMVHTGPIFYFSPTGRLVCRVRFDNVISLRPECTDDFNYLQRKFNDSKYRLEFKPREGDMIIFDNWRVLHARDEVFGKKVRQHWRGWVSNLKPAFQPDYFLGIRPIPAAIAAKIEAANKR
jgi:alpha-ketoglutarate-dependent taurine dioxygenase